MSPLAAVAIVLLLGWIAASIEEGVKRRRAARKLAREGDLDLALERLALLRKRAPLSREEGLLLTRLAFYCAEARARGLVGGERALRLSTVAARMDALPFQRLFRLPAWLGRLLGLKPRRGFFPEELRADAAGLAMALKDQLPLVPLSETRGREGSPAALLLWAEALMERLEGLPLALALPVRAVALSCGDMAALLLEGAAPPSAFRSAFLPPLLRSLDAWEALDERSRAESEELSTRTLNRLADAFARELARMRRGE